MRGQRIFLTLAVLVTVVGASRLAWAVPIASITPTTHDFGNVHVGTSAPIVFRIQNDGTGNFDVTAISQSGPECGDFTFFPPIGSPQYTDIQGGNFVTVTVTFVPSVRGGRGCTFTLTENSNDGDAETFATTGIGTAPALSIMVATDPLPCGTAAVNGGTTMCSFSIHNVGLSNEVLDYTVGSSNAAEFSVSSPAGTIAIGGNVTITITFNPTAAGVRSSTITIGGDDPFNLSDVFTVTGTGTVPTIGLLVPGSTVNLPDTDIAATSSPPLPISFSNTGLAPLNISAVTLTGGSAAQFAIASGTTGAHVVAASGSDSYTVTCTPLAPFGLKTTTFRVTSDSGGTPGTQTNFTLNCTGLQAVFAFSPPGGLAFGAIDELTSSTLPVTITNNGNRAGDVTSIVSGAGVYTFAVVGGALPRTLAAAGGSITVNVTFMPINGSTTNTNLTVGTTGSPASFNIPVTGDGIHEGVDIAITGEVDNDIDLGDVRVPAIAIPKFVTVTNSSDVSITLSLPTSNDAHCQIAPVAPTAGAYPTARPAGATATFNINTLPTAVGTGMCAISVVSNIPSTDTINVLFNGVAPDVALSSGMLDFGGVDLDNGPRSLVLTVTNTGTFPLTLTNCAVTGTGYTLDTACPPTIAIGDTADLTISFSPTSAASFLGNFTADVDAFSVSAIDVMLTGSGGEGRVAADLALDFPDTTVDDVRVRQVNVQNTGDADLIISAGSITAGSAFTLQTDLPIVLAGGDSVDLDIEFGPDAAGFSEAELTLTTDDETALMVTVSLTGTGVEGEADPDAGPGPGVDDPRTYYSCQTGGGAGLVVGLFLVLGAAVLGRRRRRSR